MPRTDRLVDIIQILRDGQQHRAEDIADQMGVSTRTIWRDMEKLTQAGVPVQGERGQGYRMAAQISLPPLTLTRQELEALNLGLAVVAQAADEEMKEAAATLAEKVDAVSPERALPDATGWKAALTPFADATRNLIHMPLFRSAIRARQKVRVTYTSPEGQVSNRVIRPLSLQAWGPVWALTAWCETVRDFNVFRLDLMDTAEALPELFVDEPGKRLEDFEHPAA